MAGEKGVHYIWWQDRHHHIVPFIPSYSGPLELSFSSKQVRAAPLVFIATRIDLTCTKRTLLIDKSLPGGSLWGCSFGGGGERTGFATLWFGVPLGSSNGWGMVRAMLVCRSPQQKADLYDQNKRFPAPPTGDTAWSMSTWLILTRIIVYLAITLLHTR